MTDFRSFLKITLRGFILGTLGLSAAAALAWNSPTASPPNNNVAAPINIGAATQTKSGGLGVGSLSVSNLSGTGVRCVQVNASGVISASSDACGSGGGGGGGDITGVTAGNGIGGGGSSGTVRLDIGEGSGINVSANAVAVDSSVARRSGGSSWTGWASFGPGGANRSCSGNQYMRGIHFTTHVDSDTRTPKKVRILCTNL